MTTTVTVHYANGDKKVFTHQNPEDYYWYIGYKFGTGSGVYSIENSKNGINGRFEITEKSEDGLSVYVEWCP